MNLAVSAKRLWYWFMADEKALGNQLQPKQISPSANKRHIVCPGCGASCMRFHDNQNTLRHRCGRVEYQFWLLADGSVTYEINEPD